MLRIKCSFCDEIANNPIANNNKPRLYRTIVTSLTQLSLLENSTIVSINPEKRIFRKKRSKSFWYRRIPSLWSLGTRRNRRSCHVISILFCRPSGAKLVCFSLSLAQWATVVSPLRGGLNATHNAPTGATQS